MRIRGLEILICLYKGRVCIVVIIKKMRSFVYCSWEKVEFFMVKEVKRNLVYVFVIWGLEDFFLEIDIYFGVF